MLFSSRIASLPIRGLKSGWHSYITRSIAPSLCPRILPPNHQSTARATQVPYSTPADRPPRSHHSETIDRASVLTAIGLGAFVIFSLSARWYINQDADHDEIVKRVKTFFRINSSSTATPQDTRKTETPAPESHKVVAASVDGPSDSTPVTHPGEDAEETEESLSTVVYRNEAAAGFPSHVRYLIVGAGSAGLSAARAIRASDPSSKVLMIAGGPNEPGLAETNNVEPPPYLRPPLSKELWRRDKARESKVLQSSGDIRRHSWLYYEPESFFLKPEELPTVEFGGVALLRGDPVVHLDANSRRATLSSGRHITYDRCLLATGASPKRLTDLEQCTVTRKNLVDAGMMSYFRNLADYRRLRDLADKYRQNGGKIAVIGGGYLGGELAVSLLTEVPVKSDATGDTHPSTSTHNLSVLHVFRQTAPMGHVLPPALASAIARFETSKGVELLPSAEVVGMSLVSGPNPTPVVEPRMSEKLHFGPLTRTVTATQNTSSPRVRLRIRQGKQVEEVDVDHVVCAVGIEPNVSLAESAGLEIDAKNGGFLVNAEMEARAGIFAAGDASSYWDPVIGMRRRVEHLNFAEETGALAGKNMAAPYAPQEPHGKSPEPARYQYQSSFWSSLGPEVSWDAVGHVDSRKLITRSFFFSDESTMSESLSIPSAEFGRLGRGVVFYLTPKEKRLVGILLWNLPEEFYTEQEYAAPSRLNIARDLLAKKLRIGQSQRSQDGRPESAEMEELRRYATYFDLAGDLEKEYAEVKAYAEQKKQEFTSKDTDLNDTVEFAGQQ